MWAHTTDEAQYWLHKQSTQTQTPATSWVMVKLKIYMLQTQKQVKKNELKSTEW